MGLTYIEGTVKPSGRRRRGKRVRFLVDSGAVYSVLRRLDWRALGLKPERELEFVLADGTTISRRISECVFELEGRRATSPVVLGEGDDEALLGAVTLETLGLMLNPLNRTLQPMRLVLARAAGLELPLGRVFKQSAGRPGSLETIRSFGSFESFEQFKRTANNPNDERSERSERSGRSIRRRSSCFPA